MSTPTPTSPAPLSQNAVLSVQYRVTRFLITNIILAILPVGIAVFLRALNNTPEPPRVYTPDILFLGVVIPATTLGDLIDELWRRGRDTRLIWGCLGTLLALILAAALYGAYRLAEIVGRQMELFRDNMTPWAFGLTIVTGLICIGYEVFLASIQQR